MAVHSCAAVVHRLSWLSLAEAAVAAVGPEEVVVWDFEGS